MWKIKHIFDGDYGCEEVNEPGMVSVTIIFGKTQAFSLLFESAEG